MWPFSHVASLSRTNFLSCNFFSPFHGCPSCSYPLGSSSEAVFLGILCLSQLHWGLLSWPSPLCPRGRHYSCLSADCKSLRVTEASCLPSGVSIKEFPPPNFQEHIPLSFRVWFKLHLPPGPFQSSGFPLVCTPAGLIDGFITDCTTQVNTLFSAVRLQSHHECEKCFSGSNHSICL